MTIVLAAADLLARLAAPGIDSAIWGPALRRFLTSPGAAGVAAVVAATIGASALYIQLVHTKAKDKNQAWWNNFEWATERAVPSKKDSTAVPISLSVNVLNSLQESATDGLQRRACGGFVDHLVTLARSAKTERSACDAYGARPLTAESEGDLQFDAFCSYVEAAADSQAISPAAENFVAEWRYEKQVLDTITELQAITKITIVDDDRLLPRGSYVRQYASVCEIDGEEIVIFVLGGSTPKLNTTITTKTRSLLNSYQETDLPLLIVCPIEHEIEEKDVRGMVVSSVAWKPGSGHEMLEKAIRDIHERASTNG